MDEKERARTLGLTLTQIEKQFGKGSIVRLGSKEAVVQVAAISSGSISLDHALGVGGFPRGRIIEIFGPESSGKTTIALQVIAEAQKVGGMAAFIDVEHALDPASTPASSAWMSTICWSRSPITPSRRSKSPAR
jgi:recombination protein RecA